MPRPKTKEELQTLSKENFQKLKDLVEGYPKAEQEKEFPAGTLNRNIRDVISHLHHWHFMFLDWYSVGMKGEKPDMPAKGYTWKTTQALNKMIYEKYKNDGLLDSKLRVQGSFEEIQKIINQHTEEELFTKKYYKWTGSTSLGSYLVSATSSHYDWAYKLIKKAMK